MLFAIAAVSVIANGLAIMKGYVPCVVIYRRLCQILITI